MRRIRIAVICQFVSCLVIFITGILIGINWNSNRENDYMKIEKHDDHDNDVKSLFIGDDPIHQSESSYLIIIIFSAVSNTARRHAIRESWLRLSGERLCRHYFVIGILDLDESQLSLLKSEQESHNDLLLFPHLKDTYTSLSHKLLSTLKWISNHMTFKFLLKVDDDSFVVLDNIFDELVERRVVKSGEDLMLYWGYFDGRAHIKRSGQWKEKNWFLCDRYLPYALGGGYIISQPIVNFVARNADMLQLFRSEDVSLGVWLAPLSVNRKHDIRFDTEFESRGCRNDYLISHKQSIQSMSQMYYSLKTSGVICKKEIKLKDVYDYNWQVLPSMCCKTNSSLT